MKTTATFRKMKQDGDPIAMLTAYDAPSARLAERAGVDLLLVGDSLGMVVLGYDSTIPVTVDDMMLHTKAVKRGARDTFVVTDLPFFSYHGDFSETTENVKRLIQEAGADAVKLEGGMEAVETVRRLVQADVPVMGHLGLTPQSVAVLGGYKVQGKASAEAETLINEAKALEKAGTFAIVLECVPKQLGALVAEQLNIPVIGIGGGADTDGQVLVYHDVIGYESDHVPKFVKQYANISSQIEDGLGNYVNDVKARSFPEAGNTFTMKDDQLEKLYDAPFATEGQ
ncbi:3-methyl-2-oxobutanoate hydroxymethyltransferase [Natribacillus halophilus]|uniref:3-methyl-2-oxobutanoate hydroxymethyltransferase n=1 Tax=Natribacillus halophilus TaxID=549003 RepID=A0A1G8NET0_9BACI|nr:3-methyl-2-oxobutanoate hydroxymethyltransferase [Natribacillus halophilus]SDI78606.1 ketopantoate hydroxymethyltransferase [Natribacillus halophilus]